MRMIAVGLLAAAGLALATSRGRNLAWGAYTRLRGRVSVEDRLAEVGPRARARLSAAFAAAGVPYPPADVVLAAFKAERRLEIHARATADAPWRLVRTLPILAASGGPGPKLRAGDGQVPEGRYRVASLNPNSRFHLALAVDYPNALDRAQAARDGRTDLGGDIMIHGGAASIGCLAMGDEAIEALFVLAADVGLPAVEILIAPCDLRSDAIAPAPGSPSWVRALHADLAVALSAFPTGDAGSVTRR